MPEQLFIFLSPINFSPSSWPPVHLHAGLAPELAAAQVGVVGGVYVVVGERLVGIGSNTKLSLAGLESMEEEHIKRASKVSAFFKLAINIF